LEEAVSAMRAREVHAALVPDASGIRRLVERRASGKADASRAFALAFCALPGAVYVGAVAEPPAILVAASDDSGVDAGRVLKAALGTVGGRGGGSPRLAQGTVPDAAALDAVVAALSAGDSADHVQAS
jgi:alanyl-tRNA synthetase